MSNGHYCSEVAWPHHPRALCKHNTCPLINIEGIGKKKCTAKISS